jgi:hypothetical protein
LLIHSFLYPWVLPCLALLVCRFQYHKFYNLVDRGLLGVLSLCQLLPIHLLVWVLSSPIYP